MTYKAVIFDLDGTLVHTTAEYRYLIVKQTLKDFGRTASDQDIDRFWFEARRDEIVKEKFGLDLESFWTKYRSYDTIELRKQYTKTYDDVDFIKELKQHGYKIGIVTGAPLHIANIEIDMLGQDFDVVIVQHMLNGFKPKPHPHGLLESLNLLGMSKNDVIFVGNADEDILTARNAQVYDVLIDRGEHSFPDICPSYKIHSLYDLRKLLGLYSR